MLRIATVFTWIGSVEHAIWRLWRDHKIVFACDNDKYCKQTYLANFWTDVTWYDDINSIDWKKYNWKIDLIVGWSPCQSFSMVWKRKWLWDDRWNLIFSYIKLIKECQPGVFIFENVKWLTTHDWWKTRKHILQEFKKIWYEFKRKILNARDYWIPQNRERVFLVWFKDKAKFEDFDFPNSIDLEITMKDLLEDNPNSKYFLWEKGKIFVTSEKNLNKRYTQINWTVALCQKANQQFNWHGDFVRLECKEVSEKYYLSQKVKNYVLASGTKNFSSKPETDLDIARPLLSTMAKMHRAWVDNYITKWEKIRKLTPRECLRLMWFSDDFKIVVSDTQAYKQAWNSIVSNIFLHLLPNIFNVRSLNDWIVLRKVSSLGRTAVSHYSW